MILGTIGTYFSNFKNKNKDYKLIFIALIAFAISILWIISITSPKIDSFPYSIKIEKGTSIKEISEDLKEQGIIRSKILFSSFVVLMSEKNKVVAGEYVFHKQPTLFNVVRRVTTGDYGIETVQIRIPEGATIKEMAKIFDEKLINFEKDLFFQLTEEKEGYLFPDTYIFLENIKTHEILEVLEKTFDMRIKESDILNSNIELKDIIKMASIIEKESTEDGKQEVSNILWSRIEIGMALQVDATFVYERGLGTFDLSIADLEEDSPYNTYTNTGLPPTPISNPGIKSIKTAAFPQKTENLYFLTGNDGKMYYAKDFEEHKRNKEKYIY